MHCRDAEELIALHVGDDLAEHEAAALEEHLEGCALCEADYASYARAREALLLLRGEEAPLAPPLWSAVAEGLEAPVAPAPAGRLRRMAVGFGVAAALAIGASAPLWLPGSTPLEPDNPGTTLAEGEDEGPDIRDVSPEELRRFFNSWTGAWPHAAEEEVELMAPASNRGEM